jgi:hypothetical protein
MRVDFTGRSDRAGRDLAQLHAFRDRLTAFTPVNDPHNKDEVATATRRRRGLFTDCLPAVR